MGAKSIQAERILGVRIYRRLVVHVYSIFVKNILFIAVIKLYLCLFLYSNILLNIYFFSPNTYVYFPIFCYRKFDTHKGQKQFMIFSTLTTY